MKNIILSADSNCLVYSAPDAVADNLRKYCLDFCNDWLINSPHAKKYRIRGGLCYGVDAFIEYLNNWVFPNEKTTFVVDIGWIDGNHPIPEIYEDCPWFNF